MLLSALKEYADEQMGEQPAPLYAMTPVAWIVTIDSDGRPVGGPIMRTDPSTDRGKRGRDMAAPEVVRSSGIKPLLLADNGEYTLGHARDPVKQERVDKAHAAYRDLVGRCAAATGEPAVLAVQRFYERGGTSLLELGEEWDYGLKGTFEVVWEDGTRCRPINLPAVQKFWLSVNTPDLDTRDQCLVCGERKPVVDRLRAKIKGIRGGQPAGTSIISANSDAFESYGLKASKVAPTCLECGEAFTRAVNALIAGEDTSLWIGGTTFIFWTRKKAGFDVGTLLQRPEPAQVKALLDSVRRGQREAASRVDDTEFYAASLSASGGRAVVRDWIDTTVGNAKESVGRWFELQRIADPWDEDPTGLEAPRPLSVSELAVSTVRKAEDLPVTTTRALFRSALHDTPPPMDLMSQAVRRNRAEQGVTRPRAALIKLVWLSHNPQPAKEDNDMVALDKENPEPAYHCGRLLAVVEEVQLEAHKPNKLNTTVVDRFYGAASSTPAVVFGALLRDTQPRLAKLSPRRPEVRGALQNSLAEVCGQISEFPKTLSLMQQAQFSLGYYHQRAHNRAIAISRASARAGQADQ